MQRTMGRPQKPDGPYDFSYIDKWGVRITMCYDAVRSQTPEQIQKRRQKMLEEVQRIRVKYAQQMIAAHKAGEKGGDTP